MMKPSLPVKASQAVVLYLAGGLPIGALLVKQHVADAMKPGDHGSTFAGSPLVCHAALTVMNIISQQSFLDDVISKGERLREGLRKALGSNSHVKEIRGLGLITGVQLDTVRLPPSEHNALFCPDQTSQTSCSLLAQRVQRLLSAQILCL